MTSENKKFCPICHSTLIKTETETQTQIHPTLGKQTMDNTFNWYACGHVSDDEGTLVDCPHKG